MKNKRNIILVVLFFILHVVGYGQQTIAGELASINRYFSSPAVYVIECRHKMYQGKANTPISIQNLTIAMQQGNIYNKTESFESISTNNLSLLVDYGSKRITLAPIINEKQKQTNSTLLNGIDSLLSGCGQKEMTKLDPQLRKITLFNCKSMYEKIELIYYIKDYKMKSIILYPRAGGDVERGSRLEIEYVQISKYNTDIKQYFSFNRFLTKTKTGYIPTETYAKFKFDNYLSKR